MQEKRLPLHLQFFAEGEGDASGAPADQNDGGADAETLESLKTALAEARAEQAKIKAALDKQMKQNGDLTKQLRSRQSQQEIEDEEKKAAEAEMKEHIASLEAYKRENEAKERYLLQGMDAELAKKAASAEVAGDMDALADIQRQNTDSLLKAKEAEWKKSMPKAHIGDGSYPAMTKEEIMAIEDQEERTKAIAKHLDLFK